MKENSASTKDASSHQSSQDVKVPSHHPTTISLAQEASKEGSQPGHLVAVQQGISTAARAGHVEPGTSQSCPTNRTMPGPSNKHLYLRYSNSSYVGFGFRSQETVTSQGVRDTHSSRRVKRRPSTCSSVLLKDTISPSSTWQSEKKYPIAYFLWIQCIQSHGHSVWFTKYIGFSTSQIFHRFASDSPVPSPLESDMAVRAMVSTHLLERPLWPQGPGRWSMGRQLGVWCCNFKIVLVQRLKVASGIPSGLAKRSC